MTKSCGHRDGTTRHAADDSVCACICNLPAGHDGGHRYLGLAPMEETTMASAASVQDWEINLATSLEEIANDLEQVSRRIVGGKIQGADLLAKARELVAASAEVMRLVEESGAPRKPALVPQLSARDLMLLVAAAFRRHPDAMSSGANVARILEEEAAKL